MTASAEKFTRQTLLDVQSLKARAAGARVFEPARGYTMGASVELIIWLLMHPEHLTR